MAVVILAVFAAAFAFMAAMTWHRMLAQLKFTEIPAALLILVCGKAYRQQLHAILVHRDTAARVAAKTRPPLPAVKPAKPGAKRPMPPSAPGRLPSAGLPGASGYPIPSAAKVETARRTAQRPVTTFADILSDDWQAANVTRSGMTFADLVESHRRLSEAVFGPEGVPGTLQLSSQTKEANIDLAESVIPAVRFQGHTATLKDSRPGEWHEGEGFR